MSQNVNLLLFMVIGVLVPFSTNVTLSCAISPAPLLI